MFTKVKVLRIDYGNRINRTNQMIVKELLKFAFLNTAQGGGKGRSLSHLHFQVSSTFLFFFQNRRKLLKNNPLSQTRRFVAKVKKDNALSAYT